MNPVAAWLETSEGELWSRRRHRLRFSRGELAQVKPAPVGVLSDGPVMRGPLDPTHDPAGAQPA